MLISPEFTSLTEQLSERDVTVFPADDCAELTSEMDIVVTEPLVANRHITVMAIAATSPRRMMLNAISEAV